MSLEQWKQRAATVAMNGSSGYRSAYQLTGSITFTCATLPHMGHLANGIELCRTTEGFYDTALNEADDA